MGKTIRKADPACLEPRRQWRADVETTESPVRVSYVGDEARITVTARLTAHDAAILASLLPQGFSVIRRNRCWFVEHRLVSPRRLRVGETTYITLPPRCELGEHFGQGIIADARITVRGSMFPHSTTAHACRKHTPTPADIVAHNAAHDETVESIQITDLTSGQVIATWSDQPVDTC